jgi:hypothetical protein
MKWLIAAAIIVLAGGLIYGLLRSSKARSGPEAYICHSCGERHCQCDRQS